MACRTRALPLVPPSGACRDVCPPWRCISWVEPGCPQQLLPRLLGVQGLCSMQSPPQRRCLFLSRQTFSASPAHLSTNRPPAPPPKMSAAEIVPDPSMLQLERRQSRGIQMGSVAPHGVARESGRANEAAPSPLRQRKWESGSLQGKISRLIRVLITCT